MRLILNFEIENSTHDINSILFLSTCVYKFNMTITFFLNMETESCNNISLDIGKSEENSFEGSE